MIKCTLRETKDCIREEKEEEEDLPYYYKNIDRNKSELILRLRNRSGCFLIRQHKTLKKSLLSSPYVLSLIGPSLKIFHYLLYRIDQYLFLKPFSNQFYQSIQDFVDQHRKKKGILPIHLIEYPIPNDANLNKSFLSNFSSFQISTNELIRKDLIGQGNFGTVYKGLYNEDLLVAIKTYSFSSKQSEDECQANLLSEFRIMIEIDHPHIVHLYGISEFDHKLCLIIEYISDGSLLQWLHQQQQQQQSSSQYDLSHRLGHFSLQICDAFKYLQSKFIIHRDLAARNCLIDDHANLVKLTDFGMAKLISSSSMIYIDKSTKPFPLRWSSPEVLISRKYSFKSDVWAFGILLWEIYSYGQIPFGEHISNHLVAQMIQKGQIPTKPSLANQFLYKQIMSSCWALKPNDRPSFTSLQQSLTKLLQLLN